MYEAFKKFPIVLCVTRKFAKTFQLKINFLVVRHFTEASFAVAIPSLKYTRRVTQNIKGRIQFLFGDS
jgi:hypothetical protein